MRYLLIALSAVALLAVASTSCQAEAELPAAGQASGVSQTEPTAETSQPGVTATAETPEDIEPTATAELEPTIAPIPHEPVDAGRSAAAVVSDPTQEAYDDALASVEALRQSDQTLVTADFSGCSLLEAVAIPKPNVVEVHAVFDLNVNCARAIEFRAFFLVETSGTNNHGQWDYLHSHRVEVITSDL